mmetsp:Transcript_63794/g.106081  ORF Transcript_63794/g.106081 Transcript_63794/m.106081 type:complete len:98 (+) Transcript_63794:84-377(+)
MHFELYYYTHTTLHCTTKMVKLPRVCYQVSVARLNPDSDHEHFKFHQCLCSTYVKLTSLNTLFALPGINVCRTRTRVFGGRRDCNIEERNAIAVEGT